jgi:hypothetical protein
MYWRFARDLRGFLRTPLTMDDCRRELAARLDQRATRWLHLVRQTVFDNPRSPYLKLLRHAGCGFADLENGVRRDGLEPTLQRLADRGVRVSHEQFKGRGEFREADFDNPRLAPHLEAATGASRSAGTRTPYELSFLRDEWAMHLVPMIAGLDLLAHPAAIWYPILPGAGTIVLLGRHKAGLKAARWFSPVAANQIRPSLRNRLGQQVVLRCGNLLGAGWPAPEYVSLAEPEKIIHWLRAMLDKHGGCCLASYTSAVAALCQRGRETGVSLVGARFTVSGEPLTAAKRAAIEATGATVYSTYASMEAGLIGGGCFQPEHADEVHFFSDSFALVQRPRPVPHADATVDAFLLTSLLPSAPKILLNVETGDYGCRVERPCGCLWEQLGLSVHLHDIRGFDKLTGAGMTFIGTDLVRVMEEVLPARFGGGATDYQMLEEEHDGRTRLVILIHPRLGPLDETVVVQTVLDQLRRGAEHNRMMAAIWQQSNMLAVRRAEPQTTRRGKLLPLHIQSQKPLD